MAFRVRAWFAFLLSFAVLLGAVSAVRAADDFLDPAVAFRFSASEAPGQVDVRFRIAEGYYLYRERFAFAVKSGQATLGDAQLPAGHVKFDQTFAKNVETYRGELVIHVPVRQAAGPFELAVTSQGCADEGICYPPAVHVVKVSGAALGAAARNDADAAAGSWFDRVTSADYAQSLLEGRGFFTIVALYFVAGIVLSLLPCSYPMIPIVSAIIVGHGARVTHAKGFALSLTYVIGMALVYTALGIAAALVGQGLGAWLQNPWVLGAFGVLLSAFAASLIAGVDIALPQRWQNGASQATSGRQGGHFIAVAAMGALSALVVGACMTAPLFAVLAFIAHTGNAFLGGAALFAMGLGLGVPLLIVGLGAGALLPRAGDWMDGVKVFFGIMLLAAALWIVWPALGGALRMLLAALWLLVAAAALGLFTPHAGMPAHGPEALPSGRGDARWQGIWRRLGRGLGAALAIWAAALLVGLAAGSTDPVKPLAVLAARTTAASGAAAQRGPAFAAIGSSAALDATIRTASQPVMLDFYADWCVSCKEMEHLTFNDARVRARLAQLHLVRADVTANNADDQALLKRFNLFGPPGIIFFDRNGREIGRVVGYQAVDTFLRSLDRVAAPSV